MIQEENQIKIVIENKAYDLTLWIHKHPGGKKIIEEFNNKDVTDYFYSIHSNKARDMLKKFKSTEIEVEHKKQPSNLFNLMKKFEALGYFESNYFLEAFSIAHTLSLFILGTILHESNPLISSICLGLGYLTTLWNAHSMSHSRNAHLNPIGHFFAELLIGYSPTWWNEKHTRHHLSTNEIDNDSDIQLIPILYLWKPTAKSDSWNRPFQHLYSFIAYSFLHIKWKLDSILIAMQNHKLNELAVFSLHYIWVFTCINWKVNLMSLIICGVILAWIVSSNHQAEDKYLTKERLIHEVEITNNNKQNKYEIHDYAFHQIITTRNINIHSATIDYLCGGMQYQIEHHLFPRMPLYNLPKIKPIIKEWCKENGFIYKEESLKDILIRNYENLKYFAKLLI